MNFISWLHIIFEIIIEISITSFLISIEIFYKIFPRKLKCVEGEIVLITGAGHGLGKRVARLFGKLNAIVICWDKNKESNMVTVQEILDAGGKAQGYTVDVTNRSIVFETAEKIQKEVGNVTILINNAGIYPVKAVLEWKQEEIQELLQVNFFAHFWTLQAFLPTMIKKKKGHVVAISSAAAIAPVAHEVPYSATKSAVTGLMDGLLQELRLNPNNNIKITCIHPYYTATRLDLPVTFDIRFGRLCPDFVAREIVKGIRENQEMITIPRFMYFWIMFLRCLPETARKRWRRIFRTVVYPQIEDCSQTGENIKYISTITKTNDQISDSNIFQVECHIPEVLKEEIHL